MAVELPGVAQPDYLATLTAVATAHRSKTPYPPSAQVVEALLSAEKAAKQTHLAYALTDLSGTWRLCFTAPRNAHFKGGVALGKGWYVPQFVPAYISFIPSSSAPSSANATGEIGNQLSLGTFQIKFTGPCRYPGKKNLLVFDFTQLQIRLFGQTLFKSNVRGGKSQDYNFDAQPTSKLPFFAFFLVTKDLVAARGRGGGLAIWVRA